MTQMCTSWTLDFISTNIMDRAPTKTKESGWVINTKRSFFLKFKRHIQNAVYIKCKCFNNIISTSETRFLMFVCVCVLKALQYVNSLRAERSGKAVKTTVLDQVAGGTVCYRCIFFSHFVLLFHSFPSKGLIFMTNFRLNYIHIQRALYQDNWKYPHYNPKYFSII